MGQMLKLMMPVMKDFDNKSKLQQIFFPKIVSHGKSLLGIFMFCAVL